MRKSKFLQSSKDMLHRSFKPDKCKISLRMVTSRLKLMKNKKEVQVKQLRREVAQLLESGQDQTARIKVEHVVREEKMMAAYELVSLYAELVMTRMPIIESQKNCPIDLKEAITSLIFASPRCSDITELVDVQKHFTAKYGKDFVGAAIELRPDCGVSRLLIEKLSVKAPDGQTKLKILTAIAEEHSIKWDPKPFGENDITAPADLLNGPASFQAAAEHIQSPWPQPPQTSQIFQVPAVHAQLPQRESSQVSQNQTQYQHLKPEQDDRSSKKTEDVNYSYSEDKPMSSFSRSEVKHSATERPTTAKFSENRNTFSSHGKNWNMDFEDAASAAQAAAESAERASMAARVAAEYANRDSMKRPYYTDPHQPGPHSRRDSSEFEELQKHPPNRYDSDRHRRSDSDKLQDVKFENRGGTPERFNQDGYGRIENYNQGYNLRSDDSVFSDSYGQASLDDGKYAQKSMHEDEVAKSDAVAKPQYKESKYRRDVQESSSSKDSHHIQTIDSQKSLDRDEAAEVNIFAKPQFDEPEYLSDVSEISNAEKSYNVEAVNSVKEKDTSFNLQPTIYDENSDHSDSDHRNFKSHAGTDSHFGKEQGQVHAGTSRTGSGNSTFAVFDEASSDHEHISFDTGPKYDDQDPDSDSGSGSMPSAKEAASNIFRIQSTQDFGFNGSKSPQKSAFQPSSPPWKHSSREFPVTSEPSVDDFKFDDQFPTKLDDSDGLSSEDQDSSHESSHKSRIYLETLPSSIDQFFPSPRSSFEEQESQGVVEKPHLKSTPYESDDEILSETSSDLSNKLNYGNLRGGLRHKRHALPSYMRTQVDNTTVESSSKISTASITTQSQGNTEVKQNTYSRKNLSSSHDDSDEDSSEDEHPVPGSISGREPYTQPAVEDTETNSRSKVSVPYCESDSDEVPQRLKQTTSGRNHMLSGLSRRTKATPSSPARSSEVQPNRDEPKSSDFSSERKSKFSPYDSHSIDEPKSRWTKDTPSGPGTPKLQPKREEPDYLNFSSDGSQFNEEPESVRTSAISISGAPNVQPKLKGTDDADFSSGRKSTFSSYDSNFTEETESPRRSSGQLRNSELSNPTRKSSKQKAESKVSSSQESSKSAVVEQRDIFQQKEDTPSTTKTSQPDRKSTFSSYGPRFTEETESPRRSSGQLRNSEQSNPSRKSSKQIPESKVSSHQESLKSTVADQSDIIQQKEDAPGTTKTSQASQSTGNAPSRMDSSKKPSHVHPKLPDYDSFAAFFKNNR